MSYIEAIKEIERQAKICAKEKENYQKEICEIISFDIIHDYWLNRFPNSVSLHKYITNEMDENWEIINRIFIDWVNEIIDLNIEMDVYLLIEFYYLKFYATIS